MVELVYPAPFLEVEVLAIRRFWSKSLILLLLAGFAGLFLNPVAANAQGDLVRVDAKGPVDMRADKVFYNERSATYTAEGEVEIVRGDNRLIADPVSLDANTLVAEAEGKVRLITPDQVITGKSMVLGSKTRPNQVLNLLLLASKPV